MEFSVLGKIYCYAKKDSSAFTKKKIILFSKFQDTRVFDIIILIYATIETVPNNSISTVMDVKKKLLSSCLEQLKQNKNTEMTVHTYNVMVIYDHYKIHQNSFLFI